MVVVLGGTCLERSRQGVVVPGTTISVSFLGGGCCRWYVLNELLLWTIRAFNITVEKLATKVGAWRDS